MLPARRVEQLGAVLEQRLAEAVDRAQRRAQIVRHRIAEVFQIGIGRLELSGALDDALLQFGVELADFLFGTFALGDILDRSMKIDNFAAGITCCLAASHNPAMSAVRAYHLGIAFVWLSLCQPFLHSSG